jgi:general secretion pathway protein G
MKPTSYLFISKSPPTDPRLCRISGRKGFTLVELLMVIAIIGILSTLGIPSYNGYKDKARNGRAMSEIRTLSTEISGYILDRQANPPDLDAINRANFRDPWQRLYIYHTVPAQEDLMFQKLNTDYDLYSTGKDGQSVDAGGNPANVDDIVRVNSSAFVGMRP